MTLTWPFTGHCACASCGRAVRRADLYSVVHPDLTTTDHLCLDCAGRVAREGGVHR